MRTETKGCSSGEEALTRAEAFVEKHGEVGDAVLSAFDEVDYCCSDMPDEYLGYAKRFMEAVAEQGLDLPTLLKRVMTNHSGDKIAELVVRKALYAGTIADGFISAQQIRQICEGIDQRLREIHERSVVSEPASEA